MTVAFIYNDMTFTDLLIIYLAFGAPLAVYKYLQNRRTEISRRVLVSSVTFFFWLPAAVEIGYIYLTNAYLRGAFVSRTDSDSATEKLNMMRESISTYLVKLSRGSNLHDLRETVDRYVSLADAARTTNGQTPVENKLFEAAGRETYQLSLICLMRRNLHRLERHHIQASTDFVALFELGSDRPDASVLLEAGIELARQLEDHPTVMQLIALKMKWGKVWTSELQGQHHAIAAIPAITMTASLNSD